MEEIVQRQLIAYNAHDIEGYCNTFSNDVQLFELPENKLTINGKPALRDYYSRRFKDNPDLWGEVTQRMAFGNFVIYYERLHGLNATDPVDIVAIYQVEDGLIRRIWFIR